MPSFPLLASPSTYSACRWDLAKDPVLRTYWLNLFRNHLPKLLAEATREAASRGAEDQAFRDRLAHMARRFLAYIDDVEAKPESVVRLDILQICLVRETMLREAGIADPYLLAKRTENLAALKLLPRLLDEIDALPQDRRMAELVEGIFAGNIFDLGAIETIRLFTGGHHVEFRQVRAKLAPRPWLVDHLDAFMARMNRADRHRCACLFVDNAGFDILLGMVPFARELIRRGTGVIVAVNDEPSLNDMTYAEMTDLFAQIGELDPVLRDALANGELEIVKSGCLTPLINLNAVSADLVNRVAARKVDLVMLEGMGRAIESNFDAQLSCDTVKIAMIKDAGVARSMGGKLYDLVIRFDQS